MIYQGRNKIHVREVILHCAAINTGQFAHKSAYEVWAIINRWHREGDRGRPAFKNGFGYHLLVMPDGQTMLGRPATMPGAHVIGRNVGTLGVLMIERQKITRMGEFRDWFTEAQRRAVRDYIGSIPGIEKVSGHNDYAPKLCPGFKVKSAEWL